MRRSVIGTDVHAGGRSASAIPVLVVLPPRTLLLDAAGPLEVLRRANVVQSRVRFDVRYVAAGRSVTTSIGLRLSGLSPLPRTPPTGAMVVLAGSVEQPMLPATATRATRATPATTIAGRRGNDEAEEARIVAWLRTAIRPDHTVVTICSGALLAGRAGLLDGYECTTHHLACDALAVVAPHARVLENRLYVEDRGRFSSAGICAGIDLMLHIVSRLTDPATAAGIARYLVVHLRRNGSDPQRSPWLEGRDHLHPAVHRVQDAITADPTRTWTLRALARTAGSSSRHLSRLFHAHAGMTVTDYRNRLRVALADQLLRHTRLDMEQIAERAGFASARQLRRAWRRLHETPPRDARVPPA